MGVNHYRTFDREPFGQGIGPFKPRGEPTGVVLRGGYVIAAWGEPDRVDMTHPVTKSLLSATVVHWRGQAGIATTARAPCARGQCARGGLASRLASPTD